ncbi:hypothetical protein EEB13_18945 [Rhodococcus sp. WS3]|nr:hypothetical protein EEB13_18945 [Rhodococcus sp. WS3]
MSTTSKSRLQTTPTIILVVFRIIVGAVAVVAPGQLEEAAVGARSKAAGSEFFGRMFGIRDLAYGIGVATSTPQERKRWLVLGVITDVGDLLAGMHIARQRKVQTVFSLVAGPMVAGVLGVLSVCANDRTD